MLSRASLNPALHTDNAHVGIHAGTFKVAGAEVGPSVGRALELGYRCGKLRIDGY